MYGTVARVRVKPGHEQEFLAIEERWTCERAAESSQIAAYVFKLDHQPDQYVLVGIFPDRETYHENARDPETDQWYRKMRDVLTDDPQWNDGEVVLHFEMRGI